MQAASIQRGINPVERVQLYLKERFLQAIRIPLIARASPERRDQLGN
jgi:hypothetical protein